MKFELKVEDIAQSQGAMIGERLLFREISFRWTAPSLQVVMGSSGAGKSTFLKSIGGVWKPLRGSVQIDGAPLWVDDEQNPQILRRIGFAFQNNALFSSLRVIENVSFPHRQRFPEMPEVQRKELALDWLNKVGLEASAYSYPHELSGGMQKRLSIARTLALKPDFIFLDDPTAGLDPITSKVMAELIHSLLAGSQALVVIVTNDPDRAKDWGPNIHFLSEQKLLSPDASEKYLKMQEDYR